MIDMGQATRAEIDIIVDWAAAEGWNPGHGDAEAFRFADPEGFFVARRDAKPIAAISVVNHNDTFAFLGLYIVTPACRGQGVGMALWSHALSHAGTRTVGLDGVPEQQRNYAASGFVSAGGTTRYTGPVRPRADQAVRSVHAGEFTDLIDAEAQASGQKKQAYLSAWFRDTSHRRTVIHEEAAGGLAFCTVRACRHGAKIGPMIAACRQDAEALIRHAAQLFPGEMTIDVPDASQELAALCADLGLAPGFQTARMYRGKVPQAAPELFAVTSLELG